jgi:hypothetical protein
MEILLAYAALLMWPVLAMAGFVVLIYIAASAAQLAVVAFQRVLIWFDTGPGDT